MRYPAEYLAIVALVIVALLSGSPAAAQSPVLPIQGTLREAAGNLVNDTRSVTFRLYNEDTGGTAFYTVNKDVSFSNGQFVTYLGDQGDAALDPEDFDGLPQVWLGIEVSPETVEMSPRVRLGTSPFALYAQMCGEAQSAVQAQSATTATTANTATTATTATTANTANNLSCSGCVDGSDVNPEAFATATYAVENFVNGAPVSQQCVGPFDAFFCALTQVTRRNDIDPSSGINRYCEVTQQPAGKWTLCARGGATGQQVKTVLACTMTCLSLQ